MKTLHKLLSALAVIALVLTACGTPTTVALPPTTAPTTPPTIAPTTSPATTPTIAPTVAPTPSGPTGELVVALSAESESMDPYFVYQSAGNSIMNAIFDTLLSVDSDGNIGTMGLAESFTVVDDTTIQFDLRTGITFHNGEAFTADDVKFSVDRIKNPDLASGLAGQYESIESVEVVDDATVIFKLSKADAAFFPNLATLQIVPMDYVTEVGDAVFATTPVGTGPFKFVEWVKDDHTLLEANPDFWAGSWKGGPLVETVRFRPIPDAAQRINEVTTGGVHIAMDLPADQTGALEGTAAEPVYKDDGGNFEIWFTANNTGTLTEDPDKTDAQALALEALQKLAVRMALNMAVDRATIIETLLGGYGQPMTNLFVPGDIGNDPAIPAYEYDPDTARQMISDAGYPDGLTIDMDVCTCDRLDPIEAVVAQLADVGVTVNIKPFELATFNDDWIAGKTNPFRSSKLGLGLDPNTYLLYWVRSGVLLSRYSNAEVDGLIDEQAITLEPDARADLLRQIGALSHDDPPALFLWTAGSLYAKAIDVDWAPHKLGYVPVFNVAVP